MVAVTIPVKPAPSEPSSDSSPPSNAIPIQPLPSPLPTIKTPLDFLVLMHRIAGLMIVHVNPMVNGLSKKMPDAASFINAIYNKILTLAPATQASCIRAMLTKNPSDILSCFENLYKLVAISSIINDVIPNILPEVPKNFPDHFGALTAFAQNVASLVQFVQQFFGLGSSTGK